MRVLHVISDENIGGAGVLLTTLLRNFDRARVESVVALPRESMLIKRIRELDVPVCYLKHSCDRPSFASVGELMRTIRREKIDLIHANAAVSARFAGKLRGIPVLHTRHCCFPPQGGMRFAPVRGFVGGVNKRLSDQVIATAEAARENLLLLGIPKEKIRVILNGSEPIREIGEAELSDLRLRYGLSAEDFTVGICARLEECKGHKTFLEGAMLAMHRMPQARFRFLIIGSGSLDGELRKEAHSLGIAHAVRFLGFVEDMAPIYRLLRVNANCSTGTETSCLALSEGMSASLPCVVSDYGGNPAMIGESHAGLLFHAGDAEAFSDALCRIASDRELEARMKQAAYERYLQKYTAASMSEQLTAVYEELYRTKVAFTKE